MLLGSFVFLRFLFRESEKSHQTVWGGAGACLDIVHMLREPEAVPLPLEAVVTNLRHRAEQRLPQVATSQRT